MILMVAGGQEPEECAHRNSKQWFFNAAVKGRGDAGHDPINHHDKAVISRQNPCFTTNLGTGEHALICDMKSRELLLILSQAQHTAVQQCFASA